MANHFNILVTSISKKVPLIKAVRQALARLNLSSKLFGGDLNSHCVARYFVDKFWHMPPQSSLDIGDLIAYCQRHEIKAIIPTRDGELLFFSINQETLLRSGISCFISKPKTIERCRNKLFFYDFLSQFNLPVIPTVQDITMIQSASYVVKECFGSGSHTIGLNLNLSQAQSWSINLESPVFQPYIEGEEYSIDLYLNRQELPQGAIVRSRELVIGGESQITRSVHHQEIEALCLKAASHLGIYGHAVFQVLCDAANGLHMIECNARFGGASTLSVAMGLRSFEWFIQESLQQPLPAFIRSVQEMRQVRYPEDKVFML